MTMSFRVKCRLTLLCAAALITATMCNAQARDLDMDSDGNYNIMAPEPGTGAHHVVRDRHARTTRHSKSPTASRAAQRAATREAAQGANATVGTPEQIETYKRNRRIYASRGSSGLVLPTPPAGPTHYAPIGTPAAPVRSVEQPGPTILPSGRAIPNLPHGPETFQDRASRCAFQSSINNIHAGHFGSYMASCM
jgi:hypothetical protein